METKHSSESKAGIIPCSQEDTILVFAYFCIGVPLQLLCFTQNMFEYMNARFQLSKMHFFAMPDIIRNPFVCVGSSVLMLEGLSDCLTAPVSYSI